MSAPAAGNTSASGTSLNIQINHGSIARTLVALRAQPGRALESYEQLLERLMQQALRRRMLFVTSPTDGDGTTTTAVNLAGVLSRRGASVLLAELRLTQPGLLRLMGNPPEVPGLEEGLRGEIQLPDCAFQVTGSPLQIMAVKSALSDAQAARQSGPLNEFIVWAETAFEWVVFDCPSVSSPAWTRWFDLNADPALLVVRSNVTQASDLKRATRQLKDHLACAILNDRQAA